MAVRLITIAAYARHRSCDEKAVRKAIEEGRITAIQQPNGRKLIDPEVADIQWAKNTRSRADSKRADPAFSLTGGAASPAAQNAASGPDSGPAAPGYADYRAIREKADAEMAQRANLKDAGLLVERASTERGVFDVVRSFRDAVMAVGQRAAPKVVGMSDARDIEHTITEETRKALEGFEARLAALLPPKENP